MYFFAEEKKTDVGIIVYRIHVFQKRPLMQPRVVVDVDVLQARVQQNRIGSQVCVIRFGVILALKVIIKDSLGFI